MLSAVVLIILSSVSESSPPACTELLPALLCLLLRLDQVANLDKWYCVKELRSLPTKADSDNRVARGLNTGKEAQMIAIPE